ncbi:MAG: 6-pyruvoyl trahydropterin synthase family protein [Phycisphaerales bacterium]
MPMYELTIERTFNATHALRLPDGSREPAHGHDWRVVVHVAADQLDACDMVVDFHLIERRLDEMLAPLQHTHLNDHPAFAKVNPSAERVAEHLARHMAEQLAAIKNAKVLKVSVTEAPGCAATFHL